MKKEDLELVIKGCIQSNRGSQGLLYKYLYKEIHNISMRYTRNREDANWYFNFGMLSIFNSLSTFDLQKSFLPWAKTIMIRSVIDQLRKRNKFKPEINVVDINISYALSNSVDRAVNEVLNKMDYEEILYFIRTLNKRQQMVFCLFEIDGYSHSEISEMTELNINTSKWILASAKKALKKTFVTKKAFFTYG